MYKIVEVINILVALIFFILFFSWFTYELFSWLNKEYREQNDNNPRWLYFLKRIVKFLPTIILFIGGFLYIPSALVGAGWVLGDLTESEGLGRSFGNLLAIFLPLYILCFYQYKKIETKRKIYNF